MKKKNLLILIIILIPLLMMSLFFMASIGKSNLKDEAEVNIFKLVKYNDNTNELEYIEPSLKIQAVSERGKDNIINICKKANVDYKLDGDYLYFNSLKDKVKIQHLRMMLHGVGLGYTTIKYMDRSGFLYYLPIMFDKNFLKNSNDASYKDILTDEDLTEEAIDLILDSYKCYGNIDENKFKDYNGNIIVEQPKSRNFYILSKHKYKINSTLIAFLLKSGCYIFVSDLNGELCIYDY